jgi:hypothetical protein
LLNNVGRFLFAGLPSVFTLQDILKRLQVSVSHIAHVYPPGAELSGAKTDEIEFVYDDEE